MPYFQDINLDEVTCQHSERVVRRVPNQDSSSLDHLRVRTIRCVEMVFRNPFGMASLWFLLE
jgi:hypothetical protein